MCKTENTMIHYKCWPRFVSNEFEMTVKVWTLAGISAKAWSDLYQYFNSVDFTEYREMIEDFYRTDRSNLNRLAWLRATKLQEKIEPFSGKIMIADIQISKLSDGINGMDFEFEMNIYLSSDRDCTDSDVEIPDIQEVQEVDSDDSGWVHYASERVREVGEDI